MVRVAKFACAWYLSALALGCAPAHTQEALGEFEPFFSRFKEVVRANDVSKIADFINFPLFIHASTYSRLEFVADRNERINFFNKYVRDQVLRSTASDRVTYSNKKEMDEDKPDFRLIPDSSPIVELDIVSERGGPAMRLVFARAGGDFKLFCLVQ
jgi:hypothetical protein